MDDGWERVGRAIRQRRHEIGLRQSTTPGISPSTWGKLENAKQASYKPFVLVRVEQALGWPSGTIDRVRNGEPVPGEEAVIDLDAADHLMLLEDRIERLEQQVHRLLGSRSDR